MERLCKHICYYATAHTSHVIVTIKEPLEAVFSTQSVLRVYKWDSLEMTAPNDRPVLSSERALHIDKTANI
jgi:hypothetical protein